MNPVIRFIEGVARPALVAALVWLLGNVPAAALAAQSQADSVSSATVGSAPATSAEAEPRMFWTLVAPSGDTVYFFGTIHLGEGSLYPLDPRILAAFDSADRLFSEISSADMKAVNAATIKLLRSSTFTDDTTLRSLLGEDYWASLCDLLGKDMAAAFDDFHPWVADIMLSQTMLAASVLDADLGLDQHLHARAKRRVVEGLDTLDQQLAILASGSIDDQLASLKNSIDEMTEGQEVAASLDELYEMYTDGDYDGFCAYLDGVRAGEEEKSEALADKWAALTDERNARWTAMILTLLNDDKTEEIFVFAGAAHFAGRGNVLELLERAGYAVTGFGF